MTRLPSVDELAREIVAREGGYVDDPDDPGGATKYGVTIHTMRRLGIDLDGDGDVDAADVKLLTVSQAAGIFKRHYFYGPGLDRLPPALQPPVFDMYVNAGATAVRILQRLLTRLGYPLADDGVIGPRTASAAQRAAGRFPDLAERYGLARRDWYYGLADGRPASRKYVRRRDGGKAGWIVRAEEFLPPHLHLSAAEHAERVSSWG